MLSLRYQWQEINVLGSNIDSDVRKDVSRQEQIFLHTTITICMAKVILKMILLFFINAWLTFLIEFYLRLPHQGCMLLCISRASLQPCLSSLRIKNFTERNHQKLSLSPSNNFVEMYIVNFNVFPKKLQIPNQNVVSHIISQAAQMVMADQQTRLMSSI